MLIYVCYTHILSANYLNSQYQAKTFATQTNEQTHTAERERNQFGRSTRAGGCVFAIVWTASANSYIYPYTYINL